MSKSKGNTINPWEMINKYGVDTLRFWMYSVNQPGEPKNFDEKTVVEIERKVFTLLDNVVKFYELYADEVDTSPLDSANILDQWILARLSQIIEENTKYLDSYKLLEAARTIREFIGDLSQWYIRRSRDRFKNEDAIDKSFAVSTTRYVLLQLAKLMAPFAPFTGEDVYLRVGGDLESVHLADWPEALAVDPNVLSTMKEVREIISRALLERDKAGIRVRQPLGELVLPQELPDSYLVLIRDEVNVKHISFGQGFVLDTTITPELVEEGVLRELIRSIQVMRKEHALHPGQAITVAIDTDAKGQAFIQTFAVELKKATNISSILFEELTKEEGMVVTIENFAFRFVFR